MNNIYFGKTYQTTSWKKWCHAGFLNIIVMSDDVVASLYMEAFQTYLLSCGITTQRLIIPTGEASKTREMKAHLEDQLFDLGCGRDLLILALGGGVVTDLSGFLAATFCRGISIIYIPTTLLAMVDAAIGGKTGVNTSYGKNLIGTITLPQAIWIDLDFLNTLPQPTYINAFAEVIKYGCIADKSFFSFLLTHANALQARDAELLRDMIQRCIHIKLHLIQDDLYDQGKRALLNFGHTIGHAIEQVSHYQLSHGEAVAIGMVKEATLSYHMGLLSEPDLNLLKEILTLYHLPTTIPAALCQEELKQALLFDKKTRRQHPYFVLLKTIGKVYTKGGYIHACHTKYLENIF